MDRLIYSRLGDHYKALDRDMLRHFAPEAAGSSVCLHAPERGGAASGTESAGHIRGRVQLDQSRKTLQTVGVDPVTSGLPPSAVTDQIYSRQRDYETGCTSL